MRLLYKTLIQYTYTTYGVHYSIDPKVFWTINPKAFIYHMIITRTLRRDVMC